MKKAAKYMEIYTDIKQKIIDGSYQIGDKLPSGGELAEKYQTSKITVKKGLDLLVAEGVLRRHSGFGTEVINLPLDHSKIFGPNESLYSTIGAEHVDSKIHTFSIELPSKKVAKMLKIDAKEYVYNIVRSRIVDNQPYSIEQTFMPLSIIPGLEPKHLEKSVYSYITDELNLDIKSSHVWLKGDLAKEEDAKILNIASGDFMIEVDKVVSLASGVPFEYSKSRHIYKDFIFEAIFVAK